MKTGTKTTLKDNETGNPLYFIGYSVMKYNGQPLLLLHTDPHAAPEICGHYTAGNVHPAKIERI